MTKHQNTAKIIMNLGMSQTAVGNHELTFPLIYSLVDSIFRNKLTQKLRNDNAGKLLYISHGIRIENNIFTTVKFGDMQVLITDAYLGKNFKDYVYDFAIVNDKPTIFIFSDTLTNPNVPRKVRAGRLFGLFNTLVELYSRQEFINITYSMYYDILMYAPVVMTVRLLENFYNRTFSLDADYEPNLFGEVNDAWFNEEALNIIHNNSDAALLEYGVLVEHFESMV